MKEDVAQFVYSCLTCQKSKIEHRKPAGLMQPLGIPEWKWDNISMDFVTGLPKTASGHDSIGVIVDRLTKSAYFIPIKITYPVAKLAEIYVRMDGQTERTIQSLEDLLRACVLKQGGSWSTHLPLIEFTYNNSHHYSIGMAPFEALYGRRCRTPLCWHEFGEGVVLGPEIVRETIDKRVGTVAYRVALPPNLSNLHDVFHVSQLRKYVPDPSHVIHMDDVQVRENLTVETMPIRIIDRENYPLSIFDRGFGVDLICFPLRNLDVILGMNWLEFNLVPINFYNKSVRFLASDDEEEVGFLSPKQLKKLSEEDDRVFTLFASLSVENQVVIDELQVVCEFPEVFPDDISYVPLERYEIYY
ncbi:uncharacterized protein LOC131659315 [Vicia villosa]|uniref:uncharacterized protein LOC131659315 n=1 Tax=Vicia villosa TaxID=3911 RepID=UPI00273B17A9|nr:uncharacterized protein LOC131659315 [Vicia villosa]